MGVWSGVAPVEWKELILALLHSISLANFQLPAET